MATRRVCLRALILLAACLLSVPPLGADIIHLKGGGKVEGRVEKQTAAWIYVRTPRGSVLKLPRDQVLRIEKTEDVWDELARRRKALSPKDAQGLFRLYQWCLKKGLKREAARLLEEVLRADPDHAGARAARGEVRIRGRWMTRREAEKAGFHFYQGRWLTHEEWMRARGFVRWGDRWLKEAEYDRIYRKAEMEKLLQMELVVENSAHFGVRSRFPQGHARQLLELAEKAYGAFTKVLPYPAGHRWKRVEIFVFATPDEYRTFMDQYIWPRRYITDEGLYRHYREAGNCNFYYPRPMLALRPSAALPNFADLATLAVHNLGHVLLHRWRRDLYPPDWLEEGLAHYVEEQVFGYARIFCLWPGRLSRRQLIVPGWRNSEEWKKKLNRLLVPGSVPPWKVLMKKPLGGMTTQELAKVYVVLRVLLEKRPDGLAAFLSRARRHGWEEVFTETFGWTPDEVDAAVKRYIEERY